MYVGYPMSLNHIFSWHLCSAKWPQQQNKTNLVLNGKRPKMDLIFTTVIVQDEGVKEHQPKRYIDLSSANIDTKQFQSINTNQITSFHCLRFLFPPNLAAWSGNFKHKYFNGFKHSTVKTSTIQFLPGINCHHCKVANPLT